MGRVLVSPKQGVYPDFDLAREMLHSGATELHKDGVTYGSLLYGSVAQGTTNLRSDCDILVVTRNDTAAMYGLKELFGRVLTQARVSVDDANIWTVDEVTQGRHTMDAAFLSHFPSSLDDNLVGQNPLGIIVPSMANFTDLLRHYIAAKKRRFTQGILTPDLESPHATLQKAFELPVNLGRKMLTVFGNEGLIPDTYRSDKGTVIGDFSVFLDQYAETNTVTGHFLKGLQLDAEYTQLIEGVVAGDIEPEIYDRAVRTLFDQAVPVARSLVQDVDEIAAQNLPGYAIEGSVQSERHRSKGVEM